MKKINIIKSKNEFTDIINNCNYKKNDYYTIYYRKNNKDNRYGVSIPTKTGKAVIRNKIKRRIKNIIDINKFIIPKTYDYVIISRKRLLELNYQEMEKHFIELVKKIGEKNEK
ncbi:MAG: ribonuclease P protein component [Bacilli bacterium]|nr:ribonuclease P protein component [Bacilli bacterium]